MEAERDLEKGNKAASQRVETLERLRTLCTSITSGKAVDEARAKNRDASAFRSKVVRAASIKAYVELRGWNGPHPVTIRGNPGYRDYVKLCNDGMERPVSRKPTSNTQRRIDIAIDTLPSMEDRDIVRRAVEMGRRDKHLLDTMKNLTSRMFGIDLDKVDGKKLTPESFRTAQGGLDQDDVKRFRALVSVLTDNDVLGDFELEYRYHRVKLIGGGTLIPPEQMQMIARLAGVGLPDEDGEPA